MTDAARDAAFTRDTRIVARFFRDVGNDEVAFNVAIALSRRAFSDDSAGLAHEHVAFALDAIVGNPSGRGAVRVRAQLSKQPSGCVHIAGPCPSPIYGSTDALIAIARAAVGLGVTVTSTRTSAGLRLVMDTGNSCYLHWSVKEDAVIAYMNTCRVRAAAAKHRLAVLERCAQDGATVMSVVMTFLTAQRTPRSWNVGVNTAFRTDPAVGTTLIEMGGIGLLQEMLQAAGLGHVAVVVSPDASAFALGDQPADWYEQIRADGVPIATRRSQKRSRRPPKEVVSEGVSPELVLGNGGDDSAVAARCDAPVVVDAPEGIDTAEPPVPKRRKRSRRPAKEPVSDDAESDAE